MTALYIAGPMRGMPDLNFPAFDDAAQRLRDAGYKVFNPADHDRWFRQVHGRLPTTPEAMVGDLEWLCINAGGIALLPGWGDSLGARAEVRVGVAIGVPHNWVSEWLKIAGAEREAA